MAEINLLIRAIADAVAAGYAVHFEPFSPSQQRCLIVKPGKEDEGIYTYLTHDADPVLIASFLWQSIGRLGAWSEAKAP